LTSLIVHALIEIIGKNPARPADLRGLSEEKIKERRDIENLTWLLRSVHWPTLENDIRQGPKIRSHMALDFFGDFEAVLKSSYFHLYDTALRTKVDALHDAWARSVAYPERYESQPFAYQYVFTTPFDRELTSGERRQWNSIRTALDKLRLAMDSLLGEIRSRFPTIDIRPKFPIPECRR